MCCAKARSRGIAPGMTLAEALTLAEAPKSLPRPLPEVVLPQGSPVRGREPVRPDIPALSSSCVHLEPHDPCADRQALEALAQGCFQFSPVVGIEDSAAPESLFLDLDGLDHLFGSQTAVARAVQQHFARQHLRVRLAVADTLGAAWAWAHFGQPEAALARIPSGSEIPPLWVPPGQTLAALRPLPVECLRLAGATVGWLHALGIYRVEQLERIAREEWPSRFGSELVRRWDQALGLAPEPICPLSPPAELELRQALDLPATSQECLLSVFSELFARAIEQLRPTGRGILAAICRLECLPAGHKMELSLGVVEASLSLEHWLDILRLRLQRVRLAGPVGAVVLKITQSALLPWRQQELFDCGSLRPDRRVLAALLDRLSSRLGAQAVLRAALRPEAQPEKSFRYQPILQKKPLPNPVPPVCTRPVPPGSRSGPLMPRSPSAVLAFRPLRLLGPVALRCMAVAPDGPPLCFHWKGRKYRTAQAWGPERIETGWWRGPRILRDYYRVETTTGHRFWLFHCGRLGRWFLHGVFE